MVREPLDELAPRLHAAAAAIAANLAELEADPTAKLLDEAPLTGASREQWQAARRSLDTLWDSYTRLCAVLDAADALEHRNARRTPVYAAEMEALLRGPSVELPPVEMALDVRGLLGNRARAVSCSPDELLDMMSGAFNQVVHAVQAAASAWSVGADRLADARHRLDNLAELAAGSSADAAPLARLRARCDVVAETILTDPIAFDAAELDALERELTAVEQPLAAVDDLRRRFPERLAEARTALGALHRAVADTAEIEAEVQVKIAGTAATPSAPVTDGLGATLDRIVALADAGRWRDAQRALTQWRAELDAAGHDVDQRSRSAADLLEARDELRGRLDAYQAMASRHRRLEDGAAAAAYGAAYDALYRAPCDLAGAAELVRRYQALAGTTATAEGSDS